MFSVVIHNSDKLNKYSEFPSVQFYHFNYSHFYHCHRVCCHKSHCHPLSVVLETYLKSLPVKICLLTFHSYYCSMWNTNHANSHWHLNTGNFEESPKFYVKCLSGLIVQKVIFTVRLFAHIQVFCQSNKWPGVLILWSLFSLSDQSSIVLFDSFLSEVFSSIERMHDLRLARKGNGLHWRCPLRSRMWKNRLPTGLAKIQLHTVLILW